MKLRKKRDLTFYRIVSSHGFKFYSPNYAHVFVQSLAALEATVTLFLGVPNHRILCVQSAFHSAYPNLHLIVRPSPVAELALDGITLVAYFKMGGRDTRRWLPLAEMNADQPPYVQE
ncbi:hypothetical protein D2Q93_01430 [Alicyclobacillaceae bacterium I2511]|nr:hypothetical protein D2Q93_01430 [Alicyclobacillaceae bacterium I2511]